MESIKILSVNPGIISPSVYSDSTSELKCHNRDINNAAKGIEDKCKKLNPFSTFWCQLRHFLKLFFSKK
jgi:hypothetical protein